MFQRESYLCMAKCFDNPNTSEQDAHRCEMACTAPLERFQAQMQNSVNPHIVSKYGIRLCPSCKIQEGAFVCHAILRGSLYIRLNECKTIINM